MGESQYEGRAGMKDDEGRGDLPQRTPACWVCGWETWDYECWECEKREGKRNHYGHPEPEFEGEVRRWGQSR